MNIKSWLETSGEPAADTAFPPGDVPNLPYIVFLDTVQRRGADDLNLIRQHNLTVERYAEDNEDNTALEALFDSAAIEYTKEKAWLPDPEDMFETIYTMTITEKD